LSENSSKSFPMEPLLAWVLHYGSWVASAAISAGLLLALIDSRAGTHNLAVVDNMRIVTAGILLFILLPVLRVALMLIVFLRERDYRFSGLAALVLVIIFLGCVLGMRMASAGLK
jgi:uncharacterized membrane protein